jgi:UDP-N-acetylmuramyl pentapeptide phosphotransferase/UDP-N-acetylglucosamine-1-phosphate transferase
VVAQTRRKRRTKHRGNAAGVVESRGRTGRKPTAGEKSGDARQLAREREQKIDRRDKPPTWRGAFIKAMVAGVLFILVVTLFIPKSGSSIALFPVVLIMYTAISYYTDRFIYDRRQRAKAKAAGGGTPR